MERISNLFDLEGGFRDSGGGRDTPPPLPSLRQRCSQDDKGEDKYSMISSQARSLGGGPPARNITFALGWSTTQPLPSVTQPDATLKDFGGGNMAATNQPQRDHGMPLEGQDNKGSLAMGGGGLLWPHLQEYQRTQGLTMPSKNGV
jgi:hypothetical protein